MRASVAMAIVFALLSASAVLAQNAQLGGIVTDPSGLVLVDAQVEAMNVGTNVVSKTVTNAEGTNFRFYRRETTS